MTAYQNATGLAKPFNAQLQTALSLALLPNLKMALSLLWRDIAIGNTTVMQRSTLVAAHEA